MSRNTLQSECEIMPIKIVDFDVYEFIRTRASKHFTISSITRAYLDTPDTKHQCEKTARQFIYRSIRKLKDKGLIQENSVLEGKAAVYSLNKETQTDKNFLRQIDCDNASTSKIQEKLKLKLNESKSALLSCIGASEAYKECFDDIPELQELLQDKYNNMREQSAKLLGKIDVYETLLNEIEV